MSRHTEAWSSLLGVMALTMAGGCGSSAAKTLDGAAGSDGSDAGAETASVPDSGIETSDAPSDVETETAPEAAPDVSEVGVDADGSTDAPATLDQGLIAYYPFDTDTKDHSGNANDCTIVGAGATSTADRHGNPAGAYQLENNTFLDCGTNASLNVTGDLTVSAWVSADSVSLSGINRNVISTGAFDLGLTNQNVAAAGFCNATGGPFFLVGTASGNTPICSPTTLASSSWHHVVGVYKAGSFLDLFLDGSEVQSVSEGIPATISATPEHLYFGRNVGPTWAAYFSGSVDEVRVYGRALSPAEVSQLP